MSGHLEISGFGAFAGMTRGTALLWDRNCVGRGHATGWVVDYRAKAPLGGELLWLVSALKSGVSQGGRPVSLCSFDELE